MLHYSYQQLRFACEGLKLKLAGARQELQHNPYHQPAAKSRSIGPKPGEVYFVELDMAQKPRSILIISVRDENAPLAIASGLAFTTQFHGSCYEVALPKLPWRREQSHVNAQSLSGYKFIELKRLQGKLESAVMQKVQAAIRTWLSL